MPRRSDSTRWFGALLAVLIALADFAPRPAHAQTAADPVVRRAMAAYEAGQLVRALALLDSVPSSLPAKDGAVRSLYRGLIQYAFGATDAAREAFSQAVRLDPSLDLDPGVHAPSRITAFQEARGAVLDSWKQEAATAEQSGEFAVAAQRWHYVLLVTPDDSTALARLAAVNEALAPRSESVQPDAVPAAVDDAAIDSQQVAVAADTAATGEVAEAATLPTFDAGQAVFLGLVFPGLGEFYTGRAVRGSLLMTGAIGAIAAGLLVEKVRVSCLSPPVNNNCPPEEVAGEVTERPYLMPAIGVAAALGVIGAIDAYIGARRANERAAEAARGRALGFAPRLEMPGIVATSRDVRIELLRLRF